VGRVRPTQRKGLDNLGYDRNVERAGSSRRTPQGNAWVSLTNFKYYLCVWLDMDFLSSIAAISNTP
jgi:hypothetical protein